MRGDMSESNDEDVRMRCAWTDTSMHAQIYTYIHGKGDKKSRKMIFAFKGGIPIYKQMPPAHETSEPRNMMFVLVVYKTLPFPPT